MFRIVHISDLHLHHDLYQPRVISALCDDIKKANEVKNIDAIAFSGDAAAKGKIGAAEIEKIMTEFVSVVREAAGLTAPFLICPGNHDIDLTKKSGMFAPVFSNITSPEKANELVRQASSTDAAALWSHVSGFRSLAKAIDSEAFTQHPLYYTKKISTSELTIGFACMNSAWMTAGGGAGDYGKLYIGEYLLDQALKELVEVDLRIAVMHHPLDWLAPEEKAKIQRFLNLNFNAVLCGHKHDNNAETLNSNVGSLFTSNTGCIYQTNEYFNGYSIVDLEIQQKKWILNAREYYFQREVFDKSNRFAADGHWETTFSASTTDLPGFSEPFIPVRRPGWGLNDIAV